MGQPENHGPIPTRTRGSSLGVALGNPVLWQPSVPRVRNSRASNRPDWSLKLVNPNHDPDVSQRRLRSERWLSGLKRLIANPLYGLTHTEGSNPFLSDPHDTALLAELVDAAVLGAVS